MANKSVSFDMPPMNIANHISTQEEVPKKKVGRPSKKPPTQSPLIKGVMEKPISDENVVEFIFQTPYIFKQLATVYRHMEILDLPLTFNSTSITSCAISRSRKTVAFLDINAKQASSYYCANPMTIGIKRSRLEEVFNSNNKKNTPPAIFNIKESSQKSYLYVTFKENDLDTVDTLPIELVTPPDEVSVEPNWRDEYPLIFVLPIAVLKEFVNFSKASTVNLVFEKTGNDNIYLLLYQGQEKLLRKKEFSNEDKLKMINKLEEGQTISVAISAFLAKPMINAKLTDNITIAIDTQKMMMLMYENELFSFRQYIELANNNMMNN